MEKKLTKSTTDRKICGVCGGIAKYLNMDSNVIRLIAIVSAFLTAGVLIYIVAALVLPDDTTIDNSNDYNKYQ